MAESKFSKTKVGDGVPGNQTFAVSGKRLEKHCQPCSTADTKAKAEYWCVDCSEYLCSPCSKTHTRFAVSRDHKIVAASQAEELSVSFDMKGLDQCKEHGKLLDFLCEDDDILCCSTCAIAKHRKCHNVVEIAKTSTADLDSLRQDLLIIESRFKAHAQRLMNIRGKVTTDATEITKKIQEMQDKMNEMFENLKKNVAKDIYTFQQQAFKDLDMKKDVCNSNITDVTEAIAQEDNVRQHGTPSQQLIMAHHLTDRVMTLKTEVDRDISDLKDINMSFDFDQSIQLPPTNNTTPGKLTMKFVPSGVTTFPDSISSQHKDQKVKLTLLASIDLKQGDGDVTEPLYLGMDFLPDGRLVIADNKNKKCLVYDQKLEKKGFVLLMDFPHDVTVMTNENVAVSSGWDMYFIKISKSNDVTLTRTLKVAINCYSICMMTNDNFLVGCLNDPQPVRVVSVGGQERTLALNFPLKQYKFAESTCAYIYNSNKAVISDRFAHTVYIYDIANNTRVDVKDEKIIKEPRGVAVGPADCIFVCSNKTNSIVQISHTGLILSSHELDMEYPLCVCVTKDNTRLAVSGGVVGGVKLQMFNIKLI